MGFFLSFFCILLRRISYGKINNIEILFYTIYQQSIYVVYDVRMLAEYVSNQNEFRSKINKRLMGYLFMVMAMANRLLNCAVLCSQRKEKYKKKGNWFKPRIPRDFRSRIKYFFFFIRERSSECQNKFTICKRTFANVNQTLLTLNKLQKRTT